MADVCPSCGHFAEFIDDKTGLCSKCMERQPLERYMERTAEEAMENRERWADRTARSRFPVESTEYARERRSRFRLLNIMRPRRAAPLVDPLTLGLDAIKAAQEVRRIVLRAAPHSLRAVALLDDVEELIRELAWGPEAAPEEQRQDAHVFQGRSGQPRAGTPCEVCGLSARASIHIAAFRARQQQAHA